MFGFSDEVRKKYGIIKGNDMKLDVKGIEALAEKIKTDTSVKPPERLMIFHENAISGEHIMRVPDVFTGRKYVLSEAEEKKCKEMWDIAEQTAKAIRKYFPKTEIYFGNGAPQLLEEFCRHKFPADLLGSRGNEANFKSEGKSVFLNISSEPVFINVDQAAEKINAGKSYIEKKPTAYFLISRLDNLDEWIVEKEKNRELEIYNFNCPRRKGNFEFKIVDDFEGETSVLQITPKLPVEGSEYLPMYEVLSHKTGIEIPGVPTKIGLMVNGNGGWGRVILELEDASGQRWISIGAEQEGEPTRWMADWFKPEEFAQLKTSNLCDWNTDDAWQRSYINFEGWRYLQFPLLGNYPGEGYHWPYLYGQ
ncbi:MAG: hypothetical protein ACP5QD_08000, partial [Candidatus Ratteibacteria bacterium]